MKSLRRIAAEVILGNRNEEEIELFGEDACRVLCKEGLMIEVAGTGFVKLPLKNAVLDGSLNPILRRFRKEIGDLESILRKAKLLKQAEESGEAERIGESIETWKNVIGQVIPKLKEHLKQQCSTRKFIKNILKIDLQQFQIDLDFDDEDGEVEESEDDETTCEYENDNSSREEKENLEFDEREQKRFKYYEE